MRILGESDYLRSFIRVCYPIDPQALIVQAVSWRSTEPYSIKVSRTGKAPPSQTTEYIRLRAATACVLILESVLRAF